jgi:hypothetical protein
METWSKYEVDRCDELNSLNSFRNLLSEYPGIWFEKYKMDCCSTIEVFSSVHFEQCRGWSRRNGIFDQTRQRIMIERHGACGCIFAMLHSLFRERDIVEQQCLSNLDVAGFEDWAYSVAPLLDDLKHKAEIILSKPAHKLRIETHRMPPDFSLALPANFPTSSTIAFRAVTRSNHRPHAAKAGPG